MIPNNLINIQICVLNLQYCPNTIHYITIICMLLLIIDGHHKLIRWRFVTHCGIDGYSRVVVFLRCSTNNRASTVLHSFSDAVSRFGVPSRVRTYQGRENMLVAQFMLQNRGHGRGSIITGSSVHNQRIERLWRDLHRCVTQLYYRLFYYLEQRRLLDPVNEVHIFALHYVYLPRINKSLEAFKDGWNMHGIRTENNKSPLQLFNAGALRLQHSGLEAMDLFQTADEEYGVDDPNVLPQGDDESEVFTHYSLYILCSMGVLLGEALRYENFCMYVCMYVHLGV